MGHTLTCCPALLVQEIQHKWPVLFDKHTLDHLAPAFLTAITAPLLIIFPNMLVITSQHLTIHGLITVFMNQQAQW